MHPRHEEERRAAVPKERFRRSKRLGRGQRVEAT
jgi:hypothetical protein